MTTSDKSLRIAIIGAGPAGIGAGHELLEQGFTEFTIFEKSDAVGGTWHLHTYPGLACDLWAHSYTFSYRRNPNWTANFVEQEEIKAYLQTCAAEFGLDSHVALNTKIVRAVYQKDKTWLLSNAVGDTFVFDVVINAMGNQHTPLFPQVEGIDSFTGQSWHGTRWNHEVDLQDKRIGIVGSAASAIQITPEVAKVAGHLTVLQRTPNWIMPRGRKFYSNATIKRFNRFPALNRAYIKLQGWMMGMILGGVTLGHKRMDQFEDRVHKFIAETIPDANMRKALTPTSRYGCKRGLVSDDFYPALMRDNVELVAEGLARVRPQGITTVSGREIDVDVIIYCTGYRLMDFDRIEVIGMNNQCLAAVMEAAPAAYKGIAAPEFPNYFFAAGPNGLAINVSYFINIERNLKTIVKLLKDKQNARITALAVKPHLNQQYNQQLGSQFGNYSWGATTCNSYYRTEEGHVPFLFPGGFKEYDRLHKQCGLHEFDAV